MTFDCSAANIHGGGVFWHQLRIIAVISSGCAKKADGHAYAYYMDAYIHWMANYGYTYVFLFRGSVMN